MTSFGFTVRIAPGVISQEVLLGETVLMDVERLVYFGLDELGSEVWRHIRRFPDADEAFDRMLSDCRLSADELEPKFYNILKGLKNSRIIELQEKPD